MPFLIFLSFLAGQLCQLHMHSQGRHPCGPHCQSDMQVRTSSFAPTSAVVVCVTWLVLHHAGCKWMSGTQSKRLLSCFVLIPMHTATGSKPCCWYTGNRLLTELSCSIRAALGDAAEPLLTTSPKTVARARTKVPSWRSGLSWSKTTCGCL